MNNDLQSENLHNISSKGSSLSGEYSCSFILHASCKWWRCDLQSNDTSMRKTLSFKNNFMYLTRFVITFLCKQRQVGKWKKKIFIYAAKLRIIRKQAQTLILWSFIVVFYLILFYFILKLFLLFIFKFYFHEFYFNTCKLFKFYFNTCKCPVRRFVWLLKIPPHAHTNNSNWGIIRMTAVLLLDTFVWKSMQS